MRDATHGPLIIVFDFWPSPRGEGTCRFLILCPLQGERVSEAPHRLVHGEARGQVRGRSNSRPWILIAAGRSRTMTIPHCFARALPVCREPLAQKTSVFPRNCLIFKRCWCTK